MNGKLGHGGRHSSSLGSSAVGSPSSTHSFFWAAMIQLRALELAARPGVVAREVLDLPGRGVRFGPRLLGRAPRSVAPSCCASSSASGSRCARDAGTHPACRPACSGPLRQAVGASRSRRTGGAWRSPPRPGRGAARRLLSVPPVVALRASFATASEEESVNPRTEDFSIALRCMCKLYRHRGARPTCSARPDKCDIIGHSPPSSLRSAASSRVT